jgi:tetratricopeptide (TPR) repeat protein
MIAELLRVEERARAAGDDPDVALFEGTVPAEVARLASIVAIAPILPVPALRSISARLWPELEHVEDDIARLRTLPFVRESPAGLRVVDGFARPLANSFWRRDPHGFREVHKALADREREHEPDSDPDGGWFIRGRIAYYLAGYDSRASVQSFGEMFKWPPVLSRTECRMWLCSLVDRQGYLLSHHEREVTFYRGFAHYVVGEWSEAWSAFEAVLGRGPSDMYRAIALHLAGRIDRAERPSQGMERLRESVDLSSTLMLTENEIMSRNTLVWSLIAAASGSPARDTKLREADMLARSNARRSRAVGDRGLSMWCARTAVMANWLQLTSLHTTLSPVPSGQVEASMAELLAVRDAATELGDWETVVVAHNDALTIYRDAGRIEEAVELVEDAARRLEWIRIESRQLTRLCQTARSLLHLTKDPPLRTRIAASLALLSGPAASSERGP